MERKFRKVAVLKGGVSSEREVSLRSGAAVAQGLRDGGHEVVEVDIVSRDFSIPEGVEAVFIALHGEFGEDGEIQQMLVGMGLPFTGSGAESSRVSFDKVLTRERLAANGIPIPRGEVLKDPGDRTIPFPLVVKPPREGSSVGIHIVSGEADWEAAFADAVRFSGEALVEEYIPGRELTVGIVECRVSSVDWQEAGGRSRESGGGEWKVESGGEDLGRAAPSEIIFGTKIETEGNGSRPQGAQEQAATEPLRTLRSLAANSNLQILPVVEIEPAAEWYDYEAKYVTGETQYTVPAKLDAGAAAALQSIALKTFECLGAEGFGRVDFRLSPDGKPYVLELNAIPGFTATSLLPKAAEAAGIGFSELCCRIMELARSHEI